MKRWIAPAAVALAVAAVLAVAPAGAQTSGTIYACIGNGRFTHVNTGSPQPCPSQTPVSWPGDVGATASPSPPPATASPSPSATSGSPSPSATASPTPAPAVCVIHLGGICPQSFGYVYPPNAMSNGFTTYVMDQSIAPINANNTLTAYDPGNWSSVENDQPYGNTSVQDGLNIQQQLNDWCGSATNWATCGTAEADTPLSALNSLNVNYSETSPQDANSIYEFGADAWPDNYPSDVMFWADTHGRCNAGSYGGTVLGTAVFDGQTWTVNRYGGPGAEIIFVLDSDPGTPNSCANQASGSIDVLAGMKWLAAGGFVPLGTMGLLNTVWEVCSADNTTFTVHSYSITVS